MNLILIFLFSVAHGVLILTTGTESCTEKNLPFPALCITNCPSRVMKPYCVLQALTQISKPILERHEIIVYADDDVLFSNWTEDKLARFVSVLGNDRVIANAETQSYPVFFHEGKKIEGPYLNSGIILGKRNLVFDLFRHISNAVAETLKVHIQPPLSWKIAKYDNSDYPTFRTNKIHDQAFFGAFYWASPHKPLILDKERKLAFMMTDIQAWVPENTKQMLNCHLPLPYPSDGMPGDDVCQPVRKQRKCERPLGIGICWRDDASKDCKAAIGLEGCSIRPRFYRHPLGVLQEVEDPLMVHFAGAQQHHFSHFVRKQRRTCRSPNRYKYYNLPNDFGASTSDFLNFADQLVSKLQTQNEIATRTFARPKALGSNVRVS